MGVRGQKSPKAEEIELSWSIVTFSRLPTFHLPKLFLSLPLIPLVPSNSTTPNHRHTPKPPQTPVHTTNTPTPTNIEKETSKEAYVA